MIGRCWWGVFVVTCAIVAACSAGRGQEGRSGHEPSQGSGSGDGGRSAAVGDGSAGDAQAARHDAGPPPIVVPDDLPWSDPRAMALEILNRCKGTDVRAVLAVSTKVNRTRRLADVGGRSACASIFGQDTWRTKAIEAWSGNVDAVRVSYEQAWAKFNDLGEDDVAVVVLKREGDRWRFDDIYNPTKERFENWGSPYQ